MDLIDGQLPGTWRNGGVPNMRTLQHPIHNYGFSVSDETMLMKHTLALAYSPVIGDSVPNENWYDEKWLAWDFKKNNSNLEMSKGHESKIPFVEKMKRKELSQCPI